MEVMNLGERPWEYSHHQSSFLPSQEKAETHIQTLISLTIKTNPNYLPLHSPFYLKETWVTSQNCSIDILVKPGVVEHIQIGAACFTQEIECYTTLFK
jgi:hypothetical protein